MGRTIHYTVEKNDNNQLTDEQWQQIEQLQERYNSSHKWGCEQLSLQRFTLYPNWDAWSDSKLTTTEIWDQINLKLKEPDGLQKLRQENLIEYKEGGYMGGSYLMSGFTKVRDSESDAALVVKFLLEASNIAPDININVNDEGNYLKCPVIIRHGRMSVDQEGLQSHLEYLFKMYEEATDEDKSFWEKFIENYKPFMKIEKGIDNNFFINQKVTV